MSEDTDDKDIDDVYRERNLLAGAFVMEKFTQGFDAGWWADDEGDTYVVVWCDLYTDLAQVGWHVPRSMVPSGLPEVDPYYDGYTNEEKNARMEWYMDLDASLIDDCGLGGGD